MKIILRDRNQGLCDAWKKQFYDTDVEIGCGHIFDVSADALVSPSNSGGFLNGGIDAVYSTRFGWGLQEALQKHLAQHHDGELCVGEAVYIPIDNDPLYNFLIAAPTMHVPMVVDGTIDAYLAFRAVLRLAKHYNQKIINQAEYDSVRWGKAVKPVLINSILCPGLGTAVGRMPYDIAAKQMREAYKVVIENKPPIFNDIGDMYNRHESLRRGISWIEI